VSYRPDESVFHRDDVPSSARKSKQQVQRYLRQRKLACDKTEWDTSRGCGFVSLGGDCLQIHVLVVPSRAGVPLLRLDRHRERLVMLSQLPTL
jgi:hypothetical protein